MITLKEAISNVFTNINNDQKREILNVLIHILQKIIENPSRAKFRSLKKDNKTFINKLLHFNGSDTVLRCLGFEEDEEKWFFPVANDHTLTRNLSEIQGYVRDNAYVSHKSESAFQQRESSHVKEFRNTLNGHTLSSNRNNSEERIKNNPHELKLGSLSKRRLEKERLELLNENENTIKLIQEYSDKWIIQIKGAENTLYSNETFKMQFKFTEKYPIESPEVIFIGEPPIHPHIYSNGHICLSILYDHWSPVLSVNSICLSIISMLSSCTKKRKPIDDMLYCSAGTKVSPKNMRWMFHDDKV
ncbi:ubiquitin-conjugating enzyme, putative [Plasmodium knowlesi strain H]|uniref:Ubiquitin-conjugating enzyme, putative n=3 Tax=Plasmodium knowlesi TaxID=5850 RepID=A0A5K1V3M5_PLAKH|nr:ubiquitin-conjugating enzyme E2, putative [Plasmodium knowlesi strain H]OTN67712.1 putative Ubiquitin conjugating enzyme [Plasmodium knowlesi]CAA9990479.1 ubiquitin-conjugating enzyme E2, putative [Plasmodium knowlesi strain H]SBO19694.1 ubiquitin-conjugating enzyme, putative [Plasmodium knowlesi strain H]SBO22484.1 ubiquitin-conjugating enzyme, putative [Plasmodium knowlesi strain H]VVS79953.1 ubiquitin-conjugating enzyme E2, putative [Plasmodium knowlesi strain H]|eukprot:XP_002260868.1 ubiquitin conjugating enzyme, putative [Plasmodium knowlesi strain H]